MPRWCWRRRYHGGAGRPPKPVWVSKIPTVERLTPSPASSADPIRIDLAELEAMRLVDLEKLSLEEAGMRMGVSRNTVWRLLEEGRRKIVKAIVEGREIRFVKD